MFNYSRYLLSGRPFKALKQTFWRQNPMKASVLEYYSRFPYAVTSCVQLPNLRKDNVYPIRYVSQVSRNSSENTIETDLKKNVSDDEETSNSSDDEELNIGDESEDRVLDSVVDIIAFINEDPLTRIAEVNRLHEVVEYLHSTYGADGIIIAQTLKRQPHLLKESMTHWREFMELLCQHGLKASAVVRMLSVCPALLATVTVSELSSNLDYLRKLGLGEKLLFKVLRNRPVLLIMKEKETKLRLAMLQTLFPVKDIHKLLPACSNILTEDFSSLEMKVHYVLFKLNLEQSDIAKCRVMAQPLEHLKVRFEFLKRCGRFTPPNPKNRKEMKSNPTLRDIVDTPDVLFATKIAGLTLLEYNVFKELVEQELVDNEEDKAEVDAWRELQQNYHKGETKK